MKEEKFSSFVDGVVVDEQLYHQLLIDKEMQNQWARYHLLGDVMRSQYNPHLGSNFSKNVALSLQNEPVVIGIEKRESLQSKQRNLWSYFSQFAIAASVCLAVIVGIQQYQSSTADVLARTEPIDAPVLQTIPFDDVTATVGYRPEIQGGFTVEEQARWQIERTRLHQLFQRYDLQEKPLDNPKLGSLVVEHIE